LPLSGRESSFADAPFIQASRNYLLFFTPACTNDRFTQRSPERVWKA